MGGWGGARDGRAVDRRALPEHWDGRPAVPLAHPAQDPAEALPRAVGPDGDGLEGVEGGAGRKRE